ncbi:alpha/beta fold hydrolase [Actinospongicola halichondriae]|uniref:alpha/beta fold hydrolase n=1 Tax=Actinospongicola halichondriae TaxID=3236844 RepID=UPI003D575D6C
MGRGTGVVQLVREYDEPDAVPGPPLPLGERIELEGRGTTFARCIPGPADAPTVLLIHGWLASGGLNWFQTFDDLRGTHGVVAPDLRGHGRGIRSRRRFRLADCADDLAALIDHLDCGPVVAVGYSMGGPVAQLLWKRHPEKVAGLVFAATSSSFVVGTRERFIFTSAMAAAAGGTRAGQQLTRLPIRALRERIPTDAPGRPASMGRWAAAEMRRHNPRTILEAGQAIGNYNARRWVGSIDVPTSCLVTTRDLAIRPPEQARLAFAISGASVHRIEDGHAACARPGFGSAVRTAVDDVVSRI